MGVTYEPCDEEVIALVDSVMRAYHTPLADAGVTTHALFARDYDETTGDAIQAVKRAGYPAAAKISVTSLADRARGIPDAKLVIDEYSWKHLDANRRRALIDHELQHLELSVDFHTMEIKLDDLERPKLKLRVHDFEVGYFRAVVLRHGKAAIEAEEIEHGIQVLKDDLADIDAKLAGAAEGTLTLTLRTPAAPSDSVHHSSYPLPR